MRASIDISQAFVHADELTVEASAIGIPPDIISITDLLRNDATLCDSRPMVAEEMIRPPGYLIEKGLVFDLEDHLRVRKMGGPMGITNRFGFLIKRPLYGSRHSPLRWWVKLSTTTKQGGYEQMRGGRVHICSAKEEGTWGTWIFGPIGVSAY